MIVAKNLILTAAHCTIGSPFTFVHFSNHQMALGLTVGHGDWMGAIVDDWALITADTGNRKALHLACQAVYPSKGTDLTVGGRMFPDQQTFPVILLGIRDEGVFSHHLPYLLIQGPIDHGDSGSPVLNEAGDIVGIVSELDLKDPNIGCAVPLESLKKALDRVLQNTCPR